MWCAISTTIRACASCKSSGFLFFLAYIWATRRCLSLQTFIMRWWWLEILSFIHQRVIVHSIFNLKWCDHRHRVMKFFSSSDKQWVFIIWLTYYGIFNLNNWRCNSNKCTLNVQKQWKEKFLVSGRSTALVSLNSKQILPWSP